MIFSSKKFVSWCILFSIVGIMIVPFGVFAQAGGLVPCDGTKANPCGYEQFIELVDNVIGYAIAIAFPIAAIMFAYAGFLYLTAAGNTGQIKQAHSIFINVAIGFIFVLAAWLIIDFILDRLQVGNEYRALTNP